MGDQNDPLMRNQNAAVQARTKVQNRTNVLQLKMIGQSHPTGLTANLLKLFEPRPPLEFKPPPEKRKCPPLTGMAQLVSKFAEPGDPEYAPPVQEAETPAQRKARIQKLRLEKGASKAAEELEKYDPHNDPNISGDPYKTLFVARLNYETTESRIKREFDVFGPIKRVGIFLNILEGFAKIHTIDLKGPQIDISSQDAMIRLVTEKETNKPKGYCFIEYMHTRDMKAAYKQADGKKIEGRRVLVDVERGRTVPNWRPRRLGGGLGTTRIGSEDVNQINSGREQSQSSGVQPRSEELRLKEDRDREKSRERGRDREKEMDKSRERSHERSRDKSRDHDYREDRHHRDRDRNRERDRERERDRGRERDRDRDRDRGRDRGRDHERDRDRDRVRDRPHEKEKDYEVGNLDHDRGRSRDKVSDYDGVESKHGRDFRGDRERNYDYTEPEDEHGWYDQLQHGHRHPDPDHDPEHYERPRGQSNPDPDDDYYEQYPHHGSEGYDQMEEDYCYDRGTSREKEKSRSGQ